MFKKGGLGKDIFQIVLYGIGLASISSVVYLAGPHVVIGNWRPLENFVIQSVVVAILVAAFAGFAGFKLWTRKKNAKALSEGIAGDEKPEDDADELGVRMKDALATLKQTSGGKTDFLYDLPWYVIIGPPGSGKTTALVNSGLKFPLSGKGGPAAIAGVGGTRYCDWWFTEDAVLVDTAGRYTTQDSDAKTDKQSWFAFLDLLKKNRPRQPINGVLVAISLQDVLTLPTEELAAHAKAIRARLLELHDRLKVDFPVYTLFTKGDLVAGFTEYFGNLGEQGRRQVWGMTFQTNDKTKNFVSEVPDEFDALIERLNQEMPDRLQEEPAPGTRAALYGFPAQMSALKRPLYEFLNAIFEPTRYHVSATLRGFYFTSGTQQGTPIDQLINALVKNFGAQEVAGNAYSGLGKSYFLTDLIQKVIIGEAAWVSTDVRAVRRARLIKAAAFAGIFAIFAAAAGAWWVSYSRNKSLIAATEGSGKEYSVTSGNLPREDVVSDRDYAKVLPLLQKLRHMPSGYSQKDMPVPLPATFGLSQWERLESSSATTYRLALERMFRPRLLYRLEEVLDARRADAGYVYEALKVYMMLGGLQPVDRDLVLSWQRQDWADNLHQGPAQAEGRKALEEHLVAMLDLEAGRAPLVDISSTIVAESQRTLARLSVSQRAYELLKSQARALNAPDWIATRSGGPDIGQVFEATGGASLDTVRIPGFFTYAGFQRAFLDQLPGVRDRIEKERWVLGNLGEQSSVAEQYRTLPNDLLDHYSREYVATWRAALAKLQVRRLTADKPRYVALTAAAAANSPFKSLFESIRDETQLTKERPGFRQPAAAGQGGGAAPAGGAPAAGSAPALSGGSNLFAGTDQVPGAAIEAQFRPFHSWIEASGGRRQIDELVAQLSEIRDNLLTSANVPQQAPQANNQLQIQIQKFRALANQLPDPFKDQMLRVVGAIQTDVNNSELGQLSAKFGAEVSGVCKRNIEGRYPVNKSTTRDISFQEFAAVFGPNGAFDAFFKNNLQKYVVTTGADWARNPREPLSSSISASTLQAFRKAQQIRETFFSGGGNLPQFAVTVTPQVLSGTGVTARFTLSGQTLTTQPGTSVLPQTIQWGGGAPGDTVVALAYDPPAATIPGTPPPPAIAPAQLAMGGPWGFFRLLDKAGRSDRGNAIVAEFLVGPRMLQYTFTFGMRQNPYSLPALQNFECPSAI